MGGGCHLPALFRRKSYFKGDGRKLTVMDGADLEREQEGEEDDGGAGAGESYTSGKGWVSGSSKDALRPVHTAYRVLRPPHETLVGFPLLVELRFEV